jgi:[ribosomal protein S5]-alanine N-acetyltransferase
MNSPVIETAPLTLRGFTESDIPHLVPLIGAREVAANNLRIPYPYEEKDARDLLASVTKENELRLAITMRSNGQLCGGIGLHPDSQHQRAELRYWIGVPYWGNSYASEAARAVVQYGFEELKLNRIFAGHLSTIPHPEKFLRNLA